MGCFCLALLNGYYYGELGVVYHCWYTVPFQVAAFIKDFFFNIEKGYV